MTSICWENIDTTLNSNSEESTKQFIKHSLFDEEIPAAQMTNLYDYSQTNIATFSTHQSACLDDLTRIPEITSQPSLVDKKSDKGFFRKFLSSAQTKTVSIEKVLDAYGVVDELIKNNDHYDVYARVYDLTSHEILDEITFSSIEFSKSDQKLLIENAIFYWFVGMENTKSGQRRRVSEFRLRRIYSPKK